MDQEEPEGSSLTIFMIGGAVILLLAAGAFFWLFMG